MLCKRCEKILTGKQLSYCSIKCSKLHLKSLYRKRKKEKINIYNQEYRKKGLRGHPFNSKILRNHKSEYPVCEKCGISENVDICHVKPRWAGGRHKDNVITLCKKASS